MVNGGFPATGRYGFEIVHSRHIFATPTSIENLRRIKSIDFFANYSRFNFNANTCDLSTAVNSNDGINRNTIEKGGRGREMFFLLRMVLDRKSVV